ncbi:uncharacterized protein LOC106520793 [Austrofundulus limnaeus]|uniref:Uncharacterized protein LOC106520793 n=1 Tax=Austrofundulus limnaeus TaxID=52670 RepID=A0A2I4BL82_AUSLI|nr:PREDICTED: uncharacterized protein LOC106520793 [Austrofundulus limnaeus]
MGQNPNLNDYAARAEFFQHNYSVLIKNMQHDDSGSYKAKVSGNKDVTKTEYQVRVVDPVSPVKLTINPDVSDVCNVTVTCSTLDSLISKTFHCNNITCSLVSNPDKTAPSSTLSVYVQQDYIICNHSNQVSSEQDKIDFRTQCEKKTALSAAIIARIAVSVLFVVVTSPCALYMYCKRKHSDKAVPESINPDPKNPAGAASGVSTEPNPVLSLSRLAQEEESRQQPARINRASKPNSAASAVNN